MLLEELKQEVDFINTSLDAFLTELKKEKFLNEHAGFSCIIYLKNHAIIRIRELMGYYYQLTGSSHRMCSSNASLFQYLPVVPFLASSGSIGHQSSHLSLWSAPIIQFFSLAHRSMLVAFLTRRVLGAL